MESKEEDNNIKESHAKKEDSEASDWEDEEELTENQKKRLRKKRATKRKNEEKQKLKEKSNDIINDTSSIFIPSELDNSRFVCLNSWKENKNWKQTDKYEIPVS